MDPKSLVGKHALVTGASRGIGAAIAEALAQAGARLTLVARNLQDLEERVERLRAWTEVQGEVGDVADPQAMESLVRRAQERFGPVAILVNNAGFVLTAPFLEINEELWQRHIEVNLGAAYRLIRLLLPGMLEMGWGRIINISSTAGLTGYPYAVPYCAAKHGLIGLTRALALELAQKGITVNAICPGFTGTDLLQASVLRVAQRTARAPEAVLELFARRNPQGRLVRPEEVAWAVVWLCSEKAAAINGQAIAVAGGEVMVG